ncbi:unnamed protein product [Colias eurytheme]|nr:unnamed protein product [Colias eurytheme]
MLFNKRETTLLLVCLLHFVIFASNASPIIYYRAMISEDRKPCVTINNDKNGICVSYYRCKNMSGDFNDEGQGTSKICSHFLEVCCPTSDVMIQ